MKAQDDKWDLRYMEMAELVATWSKDPSTKVGAVIVGSEGRILATGYNGFPRGIEDTESRLNDRSTKLRHTVHGEMNALYNALQHGVDVNGATIYCTFPICSECAKGIIQAGIKKVVIPHFNSNDLKTNKPHWLEQWKLAVSFFEEVGIERKVV